jgi:hypothetical protein
MKMTTVYNEETPVGRSTYWQISNTSNHHTQSSNETCYHNLTYQYDFTAYRNMKN